MNPIRNDRIIRLPEVIRLTGLSRSSIYAFMQKGCFPQRKKIGLRAVGWLESEIVKWIEKYFGNLSSHPL